MATEVKSKFTKIFGEPNPLMESLIEQSPELSFPQPGTLTDGLVTDIQKNKILVDLGGISTGVISGKEAHDSMGTMKEMKVGDKISAYIIESENSDGLVVLSLRKASQEKSWRHFTEAYETGEVIKVVANEANKGGLLLEVDGIKGFIPVSQLAPMHYPRVNGADSAQILQRLQQLIGITFDVKVINVDNENGKLILSEKAAMEEQRQGALGKLKVGQKLKGIISGIVKFGIFVAFDGLEGLVHISEIAWGHVKDPSEYGKIGDEIEVLVIGIEGEKISLSMKRLVPDPWLEAAKTFKVGKVVEGEVNKITPFGAFIKLGEDINGLIHSSEIGGEEGKEPAFKAGDKLKAKIISVDPEEHRIGLSIKALTEKAEKTENAEKKED
ncbi:S1 RNA-binding domain-containing protein [Candidatus Peregrinibacteria bacterium]|nr:S1 RNA-binding domain-containing protein [Candidatus Peregrinibacteria bacterium]